MVNGIVICILDTAANKKQNRIIDTMKTTTKQSLKNRIVNLLENNFTEYTIETNYPLNRLGCHGDYMDASIAVFKDNEIKLFIMIVGKTTPSHREYINTINEIKNRGYKYIVFRKYLPVNDEQIVDRLQYYL